MSFNKGWIGVDLDGTLAHYEGWKGPQHIGDPVPLMLQRVHQWLADGKTVKIFTARVYSDGSTERDVEVHHARVAIEKWCVDHIGRILEITNIKDFGMIELWDDRCYRVEVNTGVRVL